jgi:hypothetical protein
VRCVCRNRDSHPSDGVLEKHVPIIADRVRNFGAGPRRGSEAPLREITVNLTISDIQVLCICIWNSGDTPKTSDFGH